MVSRPARVLVVEVRLGHRGGIGLAPAILLLAAIGGPGASQSAGGLAERHALPVGAQPRLAPVAPVDALEEGVKARPEVVVVAHVVPVHTALPERREVARREAARDEVGEAQLRVVRAVSVL